MKQKDICHLILLLSFHGAGIGVVLDSFRGIAFRLENLVFSSNPVDALPCKGLEISIVALLATIINYLGNLFYPTKNCVILLAWAEL